MQLINNGDVIYNGRILSDIEIAPYKEMMPEILVTYTHSEIVECRMRAYKSESDPLFIEWQYDNTADKEKTWRDKVAEIKARYPLPNESA